MASMTPAQIDAELEKLNMILKNVHQRIDILLAEKQKYPETRADITVVATAVTAAKDEIKVIDDSVFGEKVTLAPKA